jgi:broad specificity phosphatase PhoE
MTRVLLISASPTPWDAEGRLGGNPMLPLTTDGEIALRKLLETIDQPINALYTFVKNQACEQAAKLAARRFNIKVRDHESLEPVSMGLWQGLTRDDLRFRFPSVFAQWEENPLSVNPPQGESLENATQRFRDGLRRILKRNRGGSFALVLRPLSLQIALGLFSGQDLPTIVKHLHDHSPMETIELPDGAPRDLSD